MHAYRRPHSTQEELSDDEEKGSPVPSTSQTSQTSHTAEIEGGLYHRKRGSAVTSSTVRDSMRNSTTIASSTDPSKTAWQRWAERWMQSHWPLLLVSFFIFAVLASSGISLFLVIASGREQALRDTVMDLAIETGAWFAKELDFAILPLFSMAQFASELDIFATLPDQIKSPGEPGALPFLPSPPNTTKAYRNVTGVCDQPELVERFTHIAAAVKRNAKMDGVLHNIQLAPEGTFSRYRTESRLAARLI